MDIDLTRPLYNPVEILDTDRWSDATWSKPLLHGDRTSGVLEFVRSLRETDRRVDLRTLIPDLYERWGHGRIGFYGGHHLDPDMVLKKHFIGAYGIEHKFEEYIDWLYDPTAEDGAARTIEWQVQLNRHYQWISLADAWQDTGEAKYARGFEEELRSWMDSCCPAPARPESGFPTAWRPIEVGIRAGWTWPLALEVFRRCDEVSDEALWMLTCGLAQHGQFLFVAPTHRNHKAMEINGLAHAGTAIPELFDAELWASTALDRAMAELDREFYPDGCQDELAPNYAMVSFSNLFSAIKCTEDYYKNPEIPKSYCVGGMAVPAATWQRFVERVRALGTVTRPDNEVADLHDSGPRQMSGIYDDLAELLPPDKILPLTESAPASSTRANATGGGPQLTEREPFADRQWEHDRLEVRPWGGYAVSQRGTTRWCLLDAGPYGTGHQHHDAQQVLMWAHGRPFCIDPGKPIYNRTARTRHIRSAAGHNVVLMDRRQHHARPLIERADTPLPMAVHEAGGLRVSAASRTFAPVGEDETQDLFRHERLLIDLPDAGWLIFDRLWPSGHAKHTWEWLWHMPVDIIETDSGSAVAFYEGGPSMRILACGPDAPAFSEAAGQEEPLLRGWWVEEATDYRPLPVLMALMQGMTGAAWMATLMIPSPEETPPEAGFDARQTGQQGYKFHVRSGDTDHAFTLHGQRQIERVKFNGDIVELASHDLPEHGDPWFKTGD